ncbi:hypothetical protein DFJ73DRAFT_771301 [Zopfochytrium polystomum]|nr:hypothetical protein DFJ73DRAFT_771301 [Zopfochytrium polystomum]
MSSFFLLLFSGQLSRLAWLDLIIVDWNNWQLTQLSQTSWLDSIIVDWNNLQLVKKGLYYTEQSVKTLLAALAVNKSLKSLDLESVTLSALARPPILFISGNGFTTKEESSGFLSRFSVLFG